MDLSWQPVAHAALFVSVALVVWVYVGYPVFLLLLRAVRSPDVRRESGHTPPVTVVIPAHNEAAVIEEKLTNLLDQDYPAELLEVIVVSDASDDGTDEIAARLLDGSGGSVLRVPERRGKGESLNRGVEVATGTAIVFTDASLLLDPGALRAVVRPFADPAVGCVSGEDYIPGGGGEGLYGRYELGLRRLESSVGSIVGASGCFYAQRREHVERFVEGMAPDFLSVLWTVRRGARAIAETEARGSMRSVRAAGREFQRKVRTMLRGITTLMAYPSLLDPFRYGAFAIALWSHKVLRWSAGFFLLLALGSNAALAVGGDLVPLLAAQGAFYALVLIGWWNPADLRRWVVFRVPFFFCMVHAAAVVAWLRYLRGHRIEVWEPSRR